MRRLSPLCLIALAVPLTAGELALQAPEEIAELLQPYLPESAGSPRKTRGLIGEILATEGYFSPVFDFTEADDGDLHLKLDPGPRTRIEQVDVLIDGALTPSRRAELTADWRLPVGRPFRQTDWNDAKQQVLSQLLAGEHAAARLLDSSAEIDAARQQAKLHVHYDAGPRYRFGELQIDGLQRYSPELVARYNRSAQAGEAYSEDKLNALQAALLASPYFSSVQAALDMDAAADDDGTVTAPVRLSLRERAAHRAAFGAGASSNTGARVEFNYNTPDLFNRAWELDSGLRLEQKKQTAYADVFLPPDDKNRRHSTGLMLENTDIQGLQTSRLALGAQSVQQRGSIEQRLSLNWQQERREADGIAATSRALVPNVMWTWRKVDSLLNPHRGIVVQAQVGGGAKAALSDQNFLRLHSRVQWYLPLGPVDTLTLRGEIGYTLADSRQHIPQDYLFRTGGTGSVRGYAYQSLGIKEGSAIVGGRYLGVVSAEATHWLNESWGIAAFVDAGDAVDARQNIKPAIGYGLGARWRSPAGPIGADLAYGERTGDIQLHFSLAIPF
ncbi:MAG: outer membrane protein assembly factor [Rhodocyclales bacterium GT-UBC]|nr:MAG: outer membrane protein assembly factor [Rhodocyclales bacterium GT-UBC]